MDVKCYFSSQQLAKIVAKEINALIPTASVDPDKLDLSYEVDENGIFLGISAEFLFLESVKDSD